MGVTTNPSLIANSGLSLEENINAILKCQSGPITVQVTAVDHSGIIEQAETLREFSERIIVKIPVTQEGLKAMESLSHLDVYGTVASISIISNPALALRGWGLEACSDLSAASSGGLMFRSHYTVCSMIGFLQ